MKIPKDKQLHIAVGFVVGTIGAAIFPALGLALGVVIGAAKELYDARNRDDHTPEFMDFVATVAGAVLGEALIAVVL